MVSEKGIMLIILTRSFPWFRNRNNISASVNAFMGGTVKDNLFMKFNVSCSWCQRIQCKFVLSSICLGWTATSWPIVQEDAIYSLWIWYVAVVYGVYHRALNVLSIKLLFLVSWNIFLKLKLVDSNCTGNIDFLAHWGKRAVAWAAPSPPESA